MTLSPTLRAVFLFVLSLAVSAANVRADEPLKKIDVSKIKTNVDEVVVPVPSEIFNVLDKLGHPAWASEVRVDDGKKPSNRYQLSLLFGTVIADGFLAVQAQDVEKVKKIGHRVLDLAAALAVKDVVESHCKSIIDAADAGDWKTVRAELDKTQYDVKAAMVKLHDKDASELVSIGGWLRGTEALTDIVQKDYNPDRAELLHQPDLLTTFDQQLNSMSPRARSTELVPQLQAGLSEIRPLIASDSDINMKAVEQVNGITKGLVKSISLTSTTGIP